MTDRYPIPAGDKEIELIIQRSRFISSTTYTPTVDAARAFIAEVSNTYPDATHHVYAFVIGYGASVIHGMSDAGEPAGTAGKPTLAVVRGSGLGDVTVVTTRYFGGIKLGTGGLVKAYTEAAQTVLAEVPRTEKVEKRTVEITVPYNLYERVTRLVGQHQGQIEAEAFEVEVSLRLTFPVSTIPHFAAQLAELSSGRIILDPEN
jgi:uncharacterized YigZ family protein